MYSNRMPKLVVTPSVVLIGENTLDKSHANDNKRKPLIKTDWDPGKKGLKTSPLEQTFTEGPRHIFIVLVETVLVSHNGATYCKT